MMKIEKGAELKEITALLRDIEKSIKDANFIINASTADPFFRDRTRTICKAAVSYDLILIHAKINRLMERNFDELFEEQPKRPAAECPVSELAEGDKAHGDDQKNSDSGAACP